MSNVILNPGSGPVQDAKWDHAVANIEAFVKDVGLDRVTVKDKMKEGDGRYEFVLRRGKKKVVVLMPGLPLDRVRFVDPKTQDIWQFPRLYVDNGSWVWKFAVKFARRGLTRKVEHAREALRKIAATGCADPYDAQKHAASGKDHCRGTCAACVARDALDDMGEDT